MCTAWTCKCGAQYGSNEISDELFWATASGVAGLGSCSCPSGQVETDGVQTTPQGFKYPCCDPSKFSDSGGLMCVCVCVNA